MAAGLLKALPLCGQPRDTKAPRSLLPSAKRGCAREIPLRKMQATGHKCSHVSSPEKKHLYLPILGRLVRLMGLVTSSR